MFKYFIVLVFFTSFADISVSGVITDECRYYYISYGDVDLYCYAKNGAYTKFKANDIGAELFFKSPLYKNDSDIVVYTHGYAETPTNTHSSMVTDAYLKLNAVSYCTVDAMMPFSVLTVFPAAVQNSKCIAEAVAIWLARIYSLGHEAEKMKIIGFSLGAQVAGSTGRHFQNNTNGVKLKRVTAVDPTLFLFSLPNAVSHTDAIEVDVYHCSAGQIGTSIVGGNADFYPNCGVEQAGCATMVCSHTRCIKLYVETISDPRNCIAVQVDSCGNFTNKNFNLTETVTPGYFWDGTPGTFYYHTNLEKPYCQGTKGISESKNGVAINFNIIDAFLGL